MRESSLIVAAIVFVSALFVGVSLLPEARATTLYVGGGGPGNYTTIQAAIDDANPGDIVYVYGGKYFENLRVNKTISLVGENRDSTVIDGGGTGDVVNITADWVNITGFTLTNGGPNFGDAGVELFSVGNCLVSDNNASSNGWDGISLWFSSNNTIVGNNASAWNTRGIFLAYSSGNVVAGNDVLSNWWVGIYLGFSDNNTIAGNTASDNEVAISAGYSRGNFIVNNTAHSNEIIGIGIWEATGNTIQGNNLSGNGIGVSVQNFGHNNEIIENNVSLSGEYGIHVDDSDGITIAGNGISRNLNGILVRVSTGTFISNNTVSLSNNVGITLQSSDGNTLFNNTVHSNGNYGVYLLSSSNNTVAGSAIINNSYGLYVLFSNYSTIVDNNASNVWRDIDMFRSTDNTIKDNRFRPANWDAIYLNSSSYVSVINNTMIDGGLLIQGDNLAHWSTHIIDTANTVNGKPIQYWKNALGGRVPDGASQVILANCVRVVVENQTVSNGSAGILLGFSSNNTVANNTVSHNLGGILLTSSVDNLIYHNNIISNTILQAWDDSFNQWDNGYPSGGNYWSNYSGSDDYSGPNQDQPGMDGIGDVPHLILSSGQDRYPLMSPFVEASPRPPSGFLSTLSGEGLENVTLKWLLSPDDSAGSMSVVAYRIYRNSTYEPHGMGYALIATVPDGTSEFVDYASGEGDPNNYLFRLCAVDLGNNTTCAFNQAGKFTRSLSTGPNLVSFLLMQSNASIDTVLQTAEYDKAWYYDSPSHEWKWHMESKGYRRGLSNMNHTMGIWVNVAEDSNLTVAGVVPAQTTIRLHGGWNLVGFPSFNATYTVADLKAETGATRVEGYDLTPPYFLRVLSDAEVLQAGYGYWVKVEAATVWTVSFD